MVLNRAVRILALIGLLGSGVYLAGNYALLTGKIGSLSFLLVFVIVVDFLGAISYLPAFTATVLALVACLQRRQYAWAIVLLIALLLLVYRGAFYPALRPLVASLSIPFGGIYGLLVLLSVPIAVVSALVLGYSVIARSTGQLAASTRGQELGPLPLNGSLRVMAVLGLVCLGVYAFAPPGSLVGSLAGGSTALVAASVVVALAACLQRGQRGWRVALFALLIVASYSRYVITELLPQIGVRVFPSVLSYPVAIDVVLIILMALVVLAYTVITPPTDISLSRGLDDRVSPAPMGDAQDG